ncbi:hypothetical protein QUF90_17915 [Desulfococcaceae bacterium HSG9]|nr:hypothetical protein [Desulfococcaceae bacterium HSG9]
MNKNKIHLPFTFSLFIVLLLSSCGLFYPDQPPPPHVKTKTILFKCDNSINHDMLLPVEVICLTTDGQLGEVAGIGPNNWFDSKERNKYPFKHTLMLRNGEDRLLRLKKMPPDAKYVVLFASYYKVEEQEPQQIVLTTDAEIKEVVWVSAVSLYH